MFVYIWLLKDNSFLFHQYISIDLFRNKDIYYIFLVDRNFNDRTGAKNNFQNRLENFSFFSMICVILSKWNQSVPNILKDNQDQSRSRPQFGFIYNKILFSLLTLCHCSIHIFGIRLCHHYCKIRKWNIENVRATMLIQFLENILPLNNSQL